MITAKIDALATRIGQEIKDLWTALAGKAPIASPAFTGTPTAPTASSGSNSTQVATTAFVSTAVAGVAPDPATVKTNQANTFTVGGQVIVNDAPAGFPLIIRAAASQTAALTSWQNSASTTLAFISATGAARFGSTVTVGTTGTPAGQLLIVPASAATQGLVIRAAASQTAALQEWRTSADAVMASVTPAGDFVSAITGGFTSNKDFQIMSLMGAI
jgi:hypothetical protein